MKVSRTVRSGGKGGKWSQSSTQTLPIAMSYSAHVRAIFQRNVKKAGSGSEPDPGRRGRGTF